MPKGRGLGLGCEIKQGKKGARAKRWRIAHLLFTDWDWPHPSWDLSRTWKRHRKTQWKE